MGFLKAVTNKEWDIFVKNGTITEKLVSRIASTIKSGKQMSMRELAIYKVHSGLIERKLKDFA